MPRIVRSMLRKIEADERRPSKQIATRLTAPSDCPSRNTSRF
jgi:hypothetical protein